MNGYDRNRESYMPSKAIGTEASQVSEQNPSGSTLISLEDITFISNSSPGYSLSADNNTKPSALSTAELLMDFLLLEAHLVIKCFIIKVLGTCVAPLIPGHWEAPPDAALTLSKRY